MDSGATHRRCLFFKSPCAGSPTAQQLGRISASLTPPWVAMPRRCRNSVKRSASIPTTPTIATISDWPSGMLESPTRRVRSGPRWSAGGRVIRGPRARWRSISARVRLLAVPGGDTAATTSATLLPMPCVFCEIVAGRIPALTVWEDRDHLLMLDIRPIAPGHLLLLPKKHSEDLFLLPEREYARL